MLNFKFRMFQVIAGVFSLILTVHSLFAEDNSTVKEKKKGILLYF